MISSGPKRNHCGWYTLFVAMTLLAVLGRAEATVVTARSVALADVSTALAAAREGDTVIVPAGTATWTSQLVITNMITFQGAGIGQTIINDGYAGRPLLSVRLSNGSPTAPLFRMTGFEFRGGISSGPGGPRFSFVGSSVASQKPLVLGCLSRFRLDNCLFSKVKSGVAYFTNLLGVMDHCTFDQQGPSFEVHHTNWTPPGQTQVAAYAHGSWADDPYWGSDKFFFVEDCDIWNYSGVPAYGMNPYAGARITLRYNTFHKNASWDAHGTEGRSNRGVKQIDAYKNKGLFDTPAHVGQIRSGSWLVHDNIFTNCKAISAQFYKFFRSNSWGQADGQNKWDSNPDTAPVASGTVQSYSGGVLTAVGNPGWTPGAFNGRDGFTYIVRNMEIPYAKEIKTQTVVGDNTANTLTKEITAETPAFPAGARFEVWRVRAGVDGPGWGKGRLMTGDIKKPETAWPNGSVKWADNGQPASWPQQGYPNEPCYAWNNPNTGTYGDQVGYSPSERGAFTEGRDFFNLGNVGSAPVQIGPVGAKYDYKPFVYPHPLVSGDPPPPSAPDSPTNLQAAPGS